MSTKVVEAWDSGVVESLSYGKENGVVKYVFSAREWREKVRQK
jgi:hypothetical protein